MTKKAPAKSAENLSGQRTSPYDIIIIGAGAAGMTAALYALRAKKSVLLFEQKLPGGQILTTHKIDNYPAAPGISGADFAKSLRSQVESFGGKIRLARVLKISELKSSENPSSTPVNSAFEARNKSPKNPPLFCVETDGSAVSEVYGKTIILANGSAERKLGLEDEAKFTGRGVSYCATCDGAFYRDKIVLVYGGGNTALYSALYLAGLAKTVYVVARHALRAEKHLVEKAHQLKNVKILENTIITALSGTNRLEFVVLQTSDRETSQTLPVDGLFVSIGRVPDNAPFENLVRLDADGYIFSGETCETSHPGVFCAGDTRQKPLHQLVTAASDGAVAASAAINFLQHS